MSRIKSQRAFFAGILLLGLSAGAAYGERGRDLRSVGQATHSISGTESFVARLTHWLTNLWEANGAILDPYGNPQMGTPPHPLGDNGPILDPYGHP
jgi:hypothetical protein